MDACFKLLTLYDWLHLTSWIFNFFHFILSICDCNFQFAYKNLQDVSSINKFAANLHQGVPLDLVIIGCLVCRWKMFKCENESFGVRLPHYLSSFICLSRPCMQTFSKPHLHCEMFSSIFIPCSKYSANPKFWHLILFARNIQQ